MWLVYPAALTRAFHLSVFAFAPDGVAGWLLCGILIGTTHLKPTKGFSSSVKVSIRAHLRDVAVQAWTYAFCSVRSSYYTCALHYGR